MVAGSRLLVATGIALGIALAAPSAIARPAPLPRSTLAVKRGGGWQVWWDASRAPVRWAAPDPMLADAVHWHAAADGVEWSELVLAGSGEAWRTRLVVARLDPRRVHLRLDTLYDGDRRAAWRVSRADPRAVFAVNAGQFVETLPWGGVILDGERYLSPAFGPLSSSVTIDPAGLVRIVAGGEGSTRGVVWAFQSYPTLLRGDTVPGLLRHPSDSIDLAHRDARAAIGRLRDGRVLVALTRFDLVGPTLGFIPFGLTTPEMAAVMGGLGASDAVMLDGGISAQLLVKGADGVHRWTGVRPVPMALVAVPR